MDLHVIDVVIFIVFALVVVGVGLIKSGGGSDSTGDYFLAGRGLTWPLIGFSLIAANISAEQMVGMAGQSANAEIGLSIASYEWMAAITLVCVGFFFLPMFLRSGIYTIPQFLEFRFGPVARTVMSVLMVVLLVSVNISLVTFLGAKFLDPYVSIASKDIGFIYPIDDIVVTTWIIGVLAALYVAVGGLKACAWADVIQGAALILGGAVITVLAVSALDSPDAAAGMNSAADVAASLGVPESAGIGERLGVLKEENMHMFLPLKSSVIPWTALVIGLWIPNFYYWGLNQYIMQRALGSKSLAEGQKGIVFAAGMKLIIPFVVCLPGIIAFTLYSDEMADRVDGNAAINRPVLLQFARASGAPLPRDVALAIAEGSGRVTAGMNDDQRLALTTELLNAIDPVAPGTTFTFDGDFADREADLAQAIMAYNAGITSADMTLALAEAGAANKGIDPEDNKPWTPGEVKAAANTIITKAIPKELKSKPLVGYVYDDAFPILVSLLAGPGFRGFVIAAVMGAVVSSLASMLNAASTIFTMDIYKRFLKPSASDKEQVLIGRIAVPVAMIVACVIAPVFANPDFGGAFNAIQSLQTYLSPGILTIFLFGLFVKRAPRNAGVVGLVLSPVLAFAYAKIGEIPSVQANDIGNLLFTNFLNRAALVVISIAAVLAVLTAVMPLKTPVVLPREGQVPMESSPLAKLGGLAVIILTIALYVVFA